MARKKAEPGTGHKAAPANGDTAREEAAVWGGETPPEAIEAGPGAGPEAGTPPEELPEGAEAPLADPAAAAPLASDPAWEGGAAMVGARRLFSLRRH